jgi:hypothetical protein
MHGAHLTLACSLACPYSQLWGKNEQFKLLKLLIALEEFDMAAEGFAVTKVRTVRCCTV